MTKPITIIGGGLAGLTLGIALRRQNVPVSLIEAGRYPRHRVCGEFVSGRGREVLADLGLENQLDAAGACEASQAAFFSHDGASAATSLPQPALCLSRYVMDASLAREFESLGGDLRAGSRWQNGCGEGVVRATGRRMRPTAAGWRWFGLKVHARGVPMTADLEMHLLANGYVGLCKLAGGVVNICGVFRARGPVPDLAANWRNWFQPADAPELRRRLAEAVFDSESFCCVGGLSLQPQSAASHAECCVGDAITMIAPVTGNGMSMAFESAQLALEPIVNYTNGQANWNETRAEVARRCDASFRRRLKWGRVLQSALLRAGPGNALVRIGGCCPALWRALFLRTRF